MSKKKIKEIKLPMRFNPGLEKYELVLPARKAGKNFKYDWKGLVWGIILIAVIILFFVGLMLVFKNYLTPIK